VTKEEIKKSIDELVDKALSAESNSEVAATEEVEKSVNQDTDRPSNGGKDAIKSGTPQTEKQDAKVKKSEDEEASDAVEKSNDQDEDDKDEDKDDKKKDKKSDKKDDKDDKNDKKKAMFKSENGDEEIMQLDEDEVELLKAWRKSNEEAEEEVEKASFPSGEELTKSIASALEPLQKGMKERDDLIKGLQDKIEKMASQPAYSKRSLDSLEPIEKGGHQATETISKSQTLNKMLELQQAGKGVSSVHIAEFEATNNISDQNIKNLVKQSFKN